MASPVPPLASGEDIIEALMGEVLASDDAERRRREEVAQRMASMILSGFAAAHQHRLSAISGSQPLTERIASCRRQRDGEYDPEKLALITANGGSTIFLNLTDPKCSALVAWVNRIVREKYFLIEPTPVSTLPPAVQLEVAQQVVATIGPVLSALDAGTLAVEDARATALQVSRDLEKARIRAIGKESRDRAEAMQRQIEDQLEEANFKQVWSEFLESCATYPFAVLEGPLIEMRPTATWEGDKRVISDQPVMVFRVVHPDDFYPGPNMIDIDHGDLYKVERIDVRDLRAQAGNVADGWSAEAIEAILSEPPPESVRSYLPEEIERAQREGRDVSISGGIADGTMTGIWRWSTLKRSDLIEWGASWAEALDKDYIDCKALLIGRHIACISRNKDPYGRRPFSLESFRHIPGQLIGEGLPEVLSDVQAGYAAAARNAVDNAALSARPCGQYDWQMVAASCHPEEIVAGKMYPVDGNIQRQSGHRAVEFFTIPNIVGELLRLAEFFKAEADNVSRIPAFAYGDSGAPGAGQTMGGLSMLMNNAAMGVEQFISNLDTHVISRLISMIYDWNIDYLPNDQYASLKGDCRVVARGALALMIQNAADEKLPELVAQASKDPNIFGLIGMEGFAKLLREMYRRFNVPGLEIVPDEDEVKERLGQAGAPLAMAGQPGVIPGQQPMAPGQPATIQPGQPAPGQPGQTGEQYAA